MGPIQHMVIKSELYSLGFHAFHKLTLITCCVQALCQTPERTNGMDIVAICRNWKSREFYTDYDLSHNCYLIAE